MTGYNTYNEYPQQKGDYTLKANPQLGLTVNNGTSSIYTNTILGIGDKYQIDLYGSMISHKIEDFPLLQILYSMGTETEAPPYIVWNDEYTGKSWIDIGLDEMRLVDNATPAGTNDKTTLPGSGYGAQILTSSIPVDITSASYEGGFYKFGAVTPAADLTTANAVGAYIDTNVSKKATVTINGTAMGVFTIAMKDTTNRGRMLNVYNRLRNLMYNFGYKETQAATTILEFDNMTTVAPIFFAFDDVHFFDGTAVSHKTELIMRLEAMSVNATELILFLNPAQANDPISSQTHMLTYINRSYDDGLDTNIFEDCISHPSRMVMIGQNYTAPLGVPEGDVFKKTGNFSFHRERYDNYSQIFITPAYGITGTTQASKFRFGDDFARTREMWLEVYKKQKVAAYLSGVKAETTAIKSDGSGSVNGQPVRKLGGLLDYGLFPITYIKKPLATLATVPSTGDKAVFFSNWLNELAGSLLAFRTGGAKAITLLCSQKFVDKLDMYVRNTFNDPWMGGKIQLSKPSQLTFGLEIYNFKTSKGINVNFVHEPALDYMISLPVAYHQFGVGYVDPKDVLLSIDTANIKQVICRPDRIYGNLQDIGQDAFLEGMRGEASFKLRYPKNHALIYVPEA